MPKKKILVVDDTESIARIIKTHLELTGNYEVKILTESQNVMHEIYVFRPDLLVLDLMMPGMGGLEIAEMLNNDPLGKDMPIIIVTALDKDIDKVKAYRLGINDYLTKPIDAGLLIASVEKAIKAKS